MIKCSEGSFDVHADLEAALKRHGHSVGPQTGMSQAGVLYSVDERMMTVAEIEAMLAFEDVAGESFEFNCGQCTWTDDRGFLHLVEDYRVGGEVWRVYKTDPDPYPSRPHAHCIGGNRRLIGCKLHLGTRQLFTSNNKPTRDFLHESDFERLIEQIRPKFPEFTLPLAT